MSDPAYDADYVEAFNNAQDDELSLQDAERQTTPGGCLSTATTALALALAVTSANVLTLNIRKVRRAITPDVSRHYFVLRQQIFSVAREFADPSAACNRFLYTSDCRTPSYVVYQERCAAHQRCSVKAGNQRVAYKVFVCCKS